MDSDSLPKLSPLTWPIAHLKLWRQFDDGNRTEAATATGFLWSHNGRKFLVTNLHNVTGKNPRSGEFIGSFAPNRVEVSIWGSADFSSDRAKSSLQTMTIDLDLNGEQVWYQHKDNGLVDIACIPISFIYANEMREIALNEIPLLEDYRVRMGSDCFILGFPEGLSGPLKTPIWKRASVASEPDLAFQSEEPNFLVDTIGNRGLSGAPVIAVGYGLIPNNAPNTIVGTGDWAAFLGVYSGRMSETGIGSQLGRVWPAQLVSEVCSACWKPH